MGLDISAYQHVSLVDDEDLDEYEHIHVVNDPSFPHTLGSLLEGRYYEPFGEQFGFRAGSYSSYNQFREDLCLVALGVTPSIVWRVPERFTGRPFFEMIHFSDCEGVIGPEVCAKLAHDFARGQMAVRPKLAEWDGLYDSWTIAYRLASKDGMVVFH